MGKQKNVQTLCATCRFADANKCSFIASGVDNAEKILAAVGAKYEVKEYMYRYGVRSAYSKQTSQITITVCPRYEKGELKNISEAGRTYKAVPDHYTVVV